MGRKLIGFAVLTALAAGTYASAPMVAAWQIREAVRAGDTARLEEKVDWQSVRKSLKSSVAETRKAIGELTDVAGLPRPGVWQRFKMAAMPFLTDPLIDRYVTAEGAPKLYAWRQSLVQRAEAVRGAARASADWIRSSAAKEQSGWLEAIGLDRMQDVAGRVRRWEFVSPMRFEIELADRLSRDRTWQAVLELRGLSWKLTEMRVAELQANVRDGDAAKIAGAP
ncbi:MAG: DUF2939 domain-containing protein [Hyphomicrobiaceae bacterium]